jgi:hypothetical protein
MRKTKGLENIKQQKQMNERRAAPFLPLDRQLHHRASVHAIHSVDYISQCAEILDEDQHQQKTNRQ